MVTDEETLQGVRGILSASEVHFSTAILIFHSANKVFTTNEQKQEFLKLMYAGHPLSLIHI